jgi:hypothetical protein
MDEQAFEKNLKKSGKKAHVIEQLIQQVRQFETYLTQDRLKSLETADEVDLNAFIAMIEANEPGRASKQVRGLALYFRFSGNSGLADRAAEYRETQVAKGRSSFLLRDFRRVDAQAVRNLNDAGITNVYQMLEAGKTLSDRQRLAQQTNISPQTILELVKLSDLSRVPGIKQIRARLYYDAGVDTLEKLAGWEHEALRNKMVEYVERTGFDGIAPLPKEVQSSIEAARQLPKIVEYD